MFGENVGLLDKKLRELASLAVNITCYALKCNY